MMKTSPELIKTKNNVRISVIGLTCVLGLFVVYVLIFVIMTFTSDRSGGSKSSSMRGYVGFSWFGPGYRNNGIEVSLTGNVSSRIVKHRIQCHGAVVCFYPLVYLDLKFIRRCEYKFSDEPSYRTY